MKKRPVRRAFAAPRLLGRLKVGPRLTIAVFVLLIPVLVLATLYQIERRELVRVAHQEDQGLDYVIALNDLLLHAAALHGSLAEFHRGDAAALARARKSEAEIDDALVRIDREEARSGALLQTAAKLSLLRQAWKRVKADAEAMTQPEALRRIGDLLDKAIDLNAQVLDTSTLTLDSRLSTHYLADTFAARSPKLLADLSMLRARAIGALTSNARLTPETRTELALSAATFAKDMAALREAVRKTASFEPSIEAVTEPAFAGAEAKMTLFLAMLGRLSVTDAPTTPVFEVPFIEAGEAAIASVHTLNQHGTRELKRVLGEVTAGLVREQIIAGAAIAAVLAVSLLLAYLGVRSVTVPIGYLTGVVDRLAQGDHAARARLASADEIGRLGAEFDRLMDERAAQENRIRAENEQLNNSVLGLLQAVAQLSRKDLTVKVPVTEDVTGPVADALNLLSSETSKVLRRVSDISADVTQASLKVKAQSDTVMSAAAEERKQVEHTALSLESASRTMAKIAEMAQSCNAAAERAIKNTEEALGTVTTTVGGINSTRETIRETEKRIKRLGERSQEISVAVNLINSIAERTHILALNASMHAASAGEAGRGFAVVADEVQRLAENARQATQQIATLVNNIQLETADTVSTMNAAITQVVEGSRLAEQAGRQMQLTQSTTAELVASVQNIAHKSQEQARASADLIQRAALIKRSTQETSKQLTEQTEQTGALVNYARNLLEAVRVFKLSST